MMFHLRYDVSQDYRFIMCCYQCLLLLQTCVQSMVFMEKSLMLSNCLQSPYQQTLLKVRSTLCVRCCVQIWVFSNQHFPRNVYNIIDHWPLCAVLCETYDIGCIHRNTTNSWLVWIFYILISKWLLMVGVGFLNYFNISLHS